MEDRKRWKNNKNKSCVLCTVCVICAFMLLTGMAGASETVSAQSIPYVYVAGNPDCYPVEYFNPQTGQYEGLMKSVYAQLSRETGIEFRYYTQDNQDQRYEYASNRQVELVTCYVGEEQSFQGLDLLFSDSICQFQVQGEQYELQLGFTPIAEDALIEQIETCLQQMDSSELLNATISYVHADNRMWLEKYDRLKAILLAAGIGLAVLTVLFVIFFWKRRSRQKRLKYVDPITRIGNAQYFIECYKNSIDEQNRYTHCAISIVFEAEELKRYLPQKVYEELVTQISESIDLMIHKEDFYAYVDTGRFELIMEMNNIDDIVHWVETFSQKLQQYMEGYALGSSSKLYFGIYILSAEDTEVYEILRKTGYATEVARKKDMLFSVYTPQMEKRFRQETMVRTMAREMMQRNEVAVFYQPILTGSDLKICAVEACSRWDNPRDGALRPDKFISVLEQSEDIADFDLYVIHQVCEWLSTKGQSMPGTFMCTVNVSRKSLSITGFADKVWAILDKFKLEASRLILEITQKEQSGQMDMLENIRRCRELGIRIAIDNYGGEGTALTDILELNPDFVKLSRYFVNETKDSEGIIRLTRLLTFLHELEVKVMIQGVETQRQMERMKLLSCDYLQGYYFYPPLPVQELEETLAGHKPDEEQAAGSKIE